MSAMDDLCFCMSHGSGLNRPRGVKGREGMAVPCIIIVRSFDCNVYISDGNLRPNLKILVTECPSNRRRRRAWPHFVFASVE